MGNVIELDMSPVSTCLEAIREDHPEGLRGCVVATITPEGEYTCTVSGMTAEQSLAASELIRQMAMDEIAQRHE